MKLIYSISLLLAFSLSLKAQNNSDDIAALFTNATTVQWQVPLEAESTDAIEWQRRNSSFAKEGIQSFVGYYKGKLVGVLSVQGSFISGSVQWKGHSYLFTTDEGKLKINHQEKANCKVHQQHSHSARPSQVQAEEPTEKMKPFIYSDGVLRYYRFALLVDYNAFVKYFNSNKLEVKNYWARAEAFLNELYNREIGVAFTIVDDDRLIIDSQDREIYNNNNNIEKELYTFTEKINRLISFKDYDLGGMLTDLDFLGGYAVLGGAYYAELKGCLYIGTPDEAVLQHEVGHLFGSDHTFSEGGTGTYETEPERGSSIMSYGKHYDIFFSLPCIYKIKEKFTAYGTGYYTDKERKNLVGLPNENSVYGVETHNRPPVIDRSKLKNSYTIPPETNFQFYIPATDPDADPLLYAAHQADFVLKAGDKNKARFTAFPFSADPLFVFQDRFHNDYWETEPYSYLSKGETGEFTFWLSANDGAYKGSNPHAVRYDMFETKLIVAEGKPFKITNIELRNSNKWVKGGKVTINWNVDDKIFSPNTKVRILFSDDEGATFKHILAENVPNIGTADVVIPLNATFIEDYYGYVNVAFKVEVIDHVAFSVKKVGQIKIENSAITFRNLPEPVLRVKANAIPEKPEVTATTSCYRGASKVNLTYQEEITATHYKRTWLATDSCRNTATYEQIIYIEEDEITPTLQWVNTPQDIYIECEAAVPTPTTLQVTGADNAKITFEETKFAKNDHQYALLRRWEATAPKAAPIAHTQIITVGDTQKPELSSYPNDMTVYGYENLPNQEQLTATDNCDGEVYVHHYQNTETDNGKKVVKYTWLAVDKSYNEKRHIQRITILPKTTPKKPLTFVQASLPANVTVACVDDLLPVEIVETQDGCGNPHIGYYDQIIERNCPNQFVIERVFMATDDCTYVPITYTQVITISDTVAPTFVGDLPQDITIKEGDVIPEQATLTAVDNCVGIASVTTSKKEETGKITYQWVATDECGNQVTHQQVITVILPLKFASFPADITVACSTEVPEVQLPPTKNGCGNVKVSYSDKIIKGNCPNEFTIERTFTATDDCTTTPITYTQVITVKDTVAPTFVGELPSNTTITEGKTIPAQATLTAVDNCGGIVSVTTSKKEETGKITYQWVAVDACGNQATYEQVITVIPYVQLSFVPASLPADVTVACSFEVSEPQLPQTQNGCDNPKVGYSDKIIKGNCRNQYTIERTFTATDDCTPTPIAYTQIITVKDTIAPTFVGELPQDMTIKEGDKLPEPPASFTSSDNCIERHFTFIPNKKEEVGKITYQWIAVDVCGNQATYEQVITVIPAVSTPTVTSPTVTTPTVTSPTVTTPTVTTPTVTSPTVTSPTVTTPTVTTPTVTTPTVTSPTVTSPTDTIPTEIISEAVVYNGISTQNHRNYFSVTPTDKDKPILLIIFDEMGLKVYENANYGNPDYFRGYANVKGVIGNKPLKGTYFYIVTYYLDGEKEIQKGYLYIK